MCTLIILRRPGHDWPLILGGNRDEMGDRPWDPPARHWEDRPEVVAGLDRLAGGTWMGVNDYGLCAVTMNRQGSLGPATGKRSRGELVLEALDHADAADASRALKDLNPDAYRPFNLFIGDTRNAFWLRNQGSDIDVLDVPPGLHMLTAGDLDDVTDPRIRIYLPRFAAAPPPEPRAEDWEEWRALLSSRLYPSEHGPRAAMNFKTDTGFGTLSSSLIALPRYPGIDAHPLWLFASGPPDREPFISVPSV